MAGSIGGERDGVKPGEYSVMGCNQRLGDVSEKLTAKGKEFSLHAQGTRTYIKASPPLPMGIAIAQPLRMIQTDIYFWRPFGDEPEQERPADFHEKHTIGWATNAGCGFS